MKPSTMFCVNMDKARWGNDYDGGQSGRAGFGAKIRIAAANHQVYRRSQTPIFELRNLLAADVSL
jgi:hypothetical protein